MEHTNEKDYSRDDLTGVPDSPAAVNLQYDAAQHQVPLPETTEVFEAPVVGAEEVVESARKIKAAPVPQLPLAVARALGAMPEGVMGADSPSGEPPSSGSIFWDDAAYFVDTVQAGGVEIRMRELSEETLQFVSSFNTRVEEATENRVSAELASHLFTGFKNAPPKILEQARAVSVDDSVLIKTMITSMRDRVLCEGIVSWEPATRPCTDENKLKLGRALRDKCVTKIFKASTFGGKEQDFLAAS